MEVIRCPECHMANFPHDWDEQTKRIFGPDCVSIEDTVGNGELWFVCPECEEQIDSKDLGREIEKEMEIIEPTGFTRDSTNQVHDMIQCLLSGGECKTKDLLTAQAVETIMLVDNLTYVKNVYYDKGERVFDFTI